MTQTMSTPATNSMMSIRAGLRSLYLLRVGFSLIWAVLVVATCHALKSADAPSAIAAVLLVAYPLWDAIATVLELRRTGTNGTPDRVRSGNVALSVAAAVAMAVAASSTIEATLLVFGVWALVSGAIQLTVALTRRRTIGAQWPMMLSGGISVLAGINFAVTSGSASAGLLNVAGYAVFGAIWFIVAVVAMRRSSTADAARRTA